MAETKKRQPAKKKTKTAIKAEKPAKTKKVVKKKTTKTKISKSVDFPIVGLGASAGGLEALEAFFSQTPSNSNMAFVIIQHLSPKHKSIMGSLLSKSTQMPVKEIEIDMEIKPNSTQVGQVDFRKESKTSFNFVSIFC